MNEDNIYEIKQTESDTLVDNEWILLDSDNDAVDENIYEKPVPDESELVTTLLVSEYEMITEIPIEIDPEPVMIIEPLEEEETPPPHKRDLLLMSAAALSMVGVMYMCNRN